MSSTALAGILHFVGWVSYTNLKYSLKSHNYVGCWCIVAQNASVLRLHGEMMKYSTFLIFTIFVTITKHISHTSLASWTLCVDICYDSVYISLPA